MTLYNNFLLKRGVGLFLRVGLISGDYGNRHPAEAKVLTRQFRYALPVSSCKL